MFRLSPGGTFAIVHAFTGGADGCEPGTSLVQGRDGAFYGTTRHYLSDSPSGAVFRMSPSGDVTVLHAFTGGPLDGSAAKGLVLASDGNLYGATFYGGLFDGGTVFRLSLSRTLTVLHSFNGADSSPVTPLIQGLDGSLYGTT